jgi:filamentous hemagglutinin family protein
MRIQGKLQAMSFASWVFFTSASHAEAVLDGSLGSERSLSGNFTITHDMGKLQENNLFHSFKTFNINPDESATFTGPDSVMNVISRVTGKTGSNIDGLLRSNMPNADFYLLNPNGIVFGENASLDVQGSFHASTADYLRLEDGKRFYASLSPESSFTIASPASFGFLDDPDSPLTGITINGSILEVNLETF